MNWKTVLQLVRVDMKSTRQLRGKKLANYNVKRNRFFSYLGYIIALIIGIAAGVLTLVIYNALSAEPNIQSLFHLGFTNFLYGLPTLIVVFTLIFSLMQQIQRSGSNFTRQAPYWLPVTWQEPTLAGSLADFLGLPMLAIVAIAPAASSSPHTLG
jgi:ABC-type amino acid transport system permease subunit